MNYKYEMHCHTSEISYCANICTKDFIETYINAGYAGVVLTNHMNRWSFLSLHKPTWKEMVDFFLDGFHLAQELAGDRLTVLLGMEICMDENDNDYLVYGFDEKFLYENENLMDMSIEQLSALTHANGLLLIQAHPFRNHMTVVNPALLDGIETHNANPRHDSRNDVAQLWAKKFNFLCTSGSDFHELEDVDRGGILVEHKIQNNAELLNMLRAQPELIQRY